MLVAGYTLPLLLVQACSSAGLAITAVIQHIGRVRAMRPPMLRGWRRGRGLGMIAVTVQPGPATRIHSVLLVLIAAGNALGVLTLLPGFNRLLTLAAGMFSGVLSGFGLALAAIGARLVLRDVPCRDPLPDHRRFHLHERDPSVLPSTSPCPRRLRAFDSKESMRQVPAT